MKLYDKRVENRYGFVHADAILTKVGDLPYTRKELALDGNPEDIVMLKRPRKTLEDALERMKGAPITIGHPPEFITADNARGQVVGAVSSIPRIDKAGKVRADVTLYDRQAIDMIKSGQDELSPGFELVLKDLTDSEGTITGMQVNHLAIVRRGRAGSSVRILDELPPALHINEVIDMDEKMLDTAVRKAVDEAMAKITDAKDFDTAKAEVVQAVTDSLAPTIAKVEKIITDHDAEAKKVADEAIEAERKAVIDKAVDAAKAHSKIVLDCMKHIEPAKHAELMDMATADVLKLAVGDMAGVEDMSVDTMRGILIGRAMDDKTEKVKAPIDVVHVGDEKKPTDVKSDIYNKIFNQARGID